MSYLVVPAVIGLFIKLLVIFFARNTKPTGRMFLPLLMLFALHNFCEVLVFWEFFRGVQGSMVVKAYYTLSCFAWALVFIYSLEVAGIGNRKLIFASIASTLVVVSITLFTNLVIEGSVLFNYSLTAIRGNLYAVWQFFCISACIATVLVIRHGYYQASNHQKEIQCIYTGLALAPAIIVTVTLLTLMSFGYHVNAVALVPIATTLFVVIMLASEYQHKLTDVRRFIPWSNERQTSQRIMDIFSEYSRDDLNYRDAVSEIERLLVLQKYDKNEGNASETAGRMGMPRSSLYSIFNRLNIESRGDQKA